MTENPTICLVSPSRNEGPFLLEWIAWHRMLGFDDILVLTHDCEDGSDRLLDRLAQKGFVRHLRHTPKAGKAPLGSAYRMAIRDAGVLAADWVMALDTDEFLQVFVGNGKIQDLARQNTRGALGMAVYWKVFGSDGQKTWQDGFVRRQFTRAAPEKNVVNTYFKSLFRNPEDFGGMSSHSPRRFSKDWGGKNIWVDSNGQPLNAIRLTKPPKHSRATNVERVTHTCAQVNHYAVKTAEGFALKSTRKSGAALVDRHTQAFFAEYDVNGETDRSALTRETAFAQEYARLTTDPEIIKMHHASCAHYVRQLCRVDNRPFETDPRYIHHRKLAGDQYP